jgi:hypothetical protein
LSLPVLPRLFQTRLPRHLDTITLNCLQKDPARRYASAASLAEDLRRFLDRRPILARPVPAWEKAWKWARRGPEVAALAAAFVIRMVGGLAAPGRVS